MFTSAKAREGELRNGRSEAKWTLVTGAADYLMRSRQPSETV
jgi:hypothetical protein